MEVGFDLVGTDLLTAAHASRGTRSPSLPPMPDSGSAGASVSDTYLLHVVGAVSMNVSPHVAFTSGGVWRGAAAGQAPR
jgi:hypothetical protein